MKKMSTIIAVAAACSAAIIASCALPVHAKGFSAPSRSYSAPRPSVKPAPPAPRVINRTTNNTTVIRETRVVNGGGSSSSFMPSLIGGAVGGVGGAMLGNALSKPAEAPVQQPQPVQQPVCDVRFYDCTPKVK